MRNHKYLGLFLGILFTAPASAGEPVGWLSYGHSKYVSSPGLEACYQFFPRFGLNMGLGAYFQYPDHNRISNRTFEPGFGFYAASLGVSGYLFQLEKHAPGLIAGGQLYYGPDYRKLRYYEAGDYYIYFDASSLQPDYGLYIGIFYVYGRYAFLGKFDFVRNRLRLGIGYRFKTGKPRQE